MGKRWATMGVLFATFVATPVTAVVLAPASSETLVSAWVLSAGVLGALGLSVHEGGSKHPRASETTVGAGTLGDVGWSEAHMAGHGACVAELERRRKRKD